MKYHMMFNFFLALMLVLISCSSKTEDASSDVSPESSAKETLEITSKQFQASEMALGQMEKTLFHEIVKAKGILDVPPANRAEVSTFFGGTVKDVNLLPGDKVRKGQILFLLENPDYVQIQQNYLEATGQLDYLKSDYLRQKNLAEDSVTSQKKYLKAASDYQVTQARIASLEKKLSLMKLNPKNLTIKNIKTEILVTAPISGYVTDVMISEGTYLTPSQVAIKIVNPDHLHLELNVFENDISKISIGQSIRFKIQNDDNVAYKANIKLINRNVDLEKRTVGIHGHLEDESLAEQLIPGMYIEADIYATSEERWALPNNALVDIEGKFYALVLTKKSESQYTFVKREVKTGQSNSQQTEILNVQDFKENTDFIINGAFNLITE